ncbi:MAG: hypothetical protein A3H42_06215 [Deltaproteobacteria bacterium RIFCSPLOWO2_02_FULL_46_8]|nr:MAG: hypothetical protein A3H42_06215 [Deltaproteobacteria bacterium RIFCSPLOWO2_02_FULL_46_8]
MNDHRNHREFIEKAEKQITILREAVDDLEALLHLERGLGKIRSSTQVVMQRALTKAQIVILAALYKKNKRGVPFFVECLAKSGSMQFKGANKELLNNYDELEQNIKFLRDKVCSHLDVSIYGKKHGPAMIKIFKQPELLRRIKQCCDQTIAIGKKIKTSKQSY